MPNVLIAASAGPHGAIYPTGSVSVEIGLDQSFAITPYSGWTIQDVLVDGVSVGAVATYVFLDLAINHTIAAAFGTAPFSPDQFRIDFPEFVDKTKYPDPMITFWAGLGDTLLNVRRWRDLRPYGLSLYVAHNVALAAMNRAAAIAGGMPGQNVGITNHESVGPLSVASDVQSSIEENGGQYNLTTYGSQFLRLSRIVGMGGAQIW